jgi:hypothetical protein
VNKAPFSTLVAWKLLSLRPTKEEALQLEQAKKVAVAPGQVIFFYQNILHQVNPVRLKSESCRLHIPLFPLEEVFDTFRPFCLPSGQDSRMWAKLHWTNWADKILVPFSQKFHPDLLEERPVKKNHHPRDFGADQTDASVVYAV